MDPAALMKLSPFQWPPPADDGEKTESRLESLTPQGMLRLTLWVFCGPSKVATQNREKRGTQGFLGLQF